MNHCILFFLLICAWVLAPLGLRSQHAQMDSLLAQLESQPEPDTARASTLYHLCNTCLKQAKLKQGIACGNELVALARKAELPLYEAKGSACIGVIYGDMGKYKQGLEYLFRAKE